MKSATIYRGMGKWYVLPSSLTTAGVWLDCDPVSVLNESEVAQKKGAAIHRALGLSSRGIPHPIDPNAQVSSILETAGVRSWDELEKRTEPLTVRSDGQQIQFIRWQRAPRQGWIQDIGNEVSVPSADMSDERLGTEAESLFERTSKSHQ